MTMNSPNHYVQLAACAKHYIAIERGEGKRASMDCPYCELAAVRERANLYERTLNAFEQTCPDHHTYLFATAKMECPECQIQRVRELPRYSTGEIKDEYGDDPSVLWISEYELEAIINAHKEN